MPYQPEATILADVLWRASQLKPAVFKEVLVCLFTLQEIEAIEQRWHVFQLLAQGESYRAIANKIGVSKTTVAKTARTFQGSHESFKEILRQE